MAVAATQMFSVVSGNLFVDRKLMLSTTDYINNENVKEDQVFQLVLKFVLLKYGIIEPNSFKMQRGTLQASFTVTDQETSIKVNYKGKSKFEFKEGEVIILSCYMPNSTEKDKVVAVDYVTKHSLENNDWKEKSGKSRDNYGVKT